MSKIYFNLDQLGDDHTLLENALEIALDNNSCSVMLTRADEGYPQLFVETQRLQDRLDERADAPGDGIAQGFRRSCAGDFRLAHAHLAGFQAGVNFVRALVRVLADEPHNHGDGEDDRAGFA